jgi:hypothetical protein
MLKIPEGELFVVSIKKCLIVIQLECICNMPKSSASIGCAIFCSSISIQPNAVLFQCFCEAYPCAIGVQFSTLTDPPGQDFGHKRILVKVV